MTEKVKNQVACKGDGEHYTLSNEFIRMPKRLDIAALQIFGLALTKIDWKHDNHGDTTVRFTLDEVRKACGSESHNYGWYKSALEQLQKKACVKIDVDDHYYSAVVFTVVEIKDQNIVEVTFNQKLKPYIEGLYSHYTTFRLSSTAKFQSRFSYILYTNLRSWHDYRHNRVDALDERERYYTTAQLKQMFDLKPDEYCRKNGKFDRYSFERYVVQAAVDEINYNSKDCGMRIGWHKEYEDDNRRVRYYVFQFTMCDWEEPMPDYYITP